MPIAIRFVEQRYCPVVICDHCAKEIKNMGNVEHKGIPNGLAFNAALVFLHKNCTRPYEEAHGGRAEFMWDELDVFLYDLLHNSGIKPRPGLNS